MKKGFISSIVAAVFSVIAFVGLGLDFFLVMVSAGNEVKTESGSFGDWQNLLQELTDAGSDKVAMWNVASWLMWIVLVIVLVAVVAAFVKNFLNLGVLRLIGKIAGIVGIIATLGWFVVFFAGCSNLTYGISNFSITYLPSVGSGMFAGGLFAASIAALVSSKKVKTA